MRKLLLEAGKQGKCLMLESSGELKKKLRDRYFNQHNDENLLFFE